jgi:hypothetical protein
MKTILHIICILFDHKWKIKYVDSGPVLYIDKIRTCCRCGKKQTLSPYSSSRHTFVEKWIDE